MNKFTRSLIGAAFVALAATPAFADTPKDSLVMAWQFDDIISLDPAEIFEVSGAEYGAQVYDRLIGIDLKDTSKIVPAVAESWTVSDDGKTYTFKIRDGVKFHSGNPLTAEDAAYSLQRAVKLNKSPAFILTQFGFTKDNVDQKIEAADARTLASRHSGGRIVVWDRDEETPRLVLADPDEATWCPRLSRDGRLLATTDGSGGAWP